MQDLALRVRVKTLQQRGAGARDGGPDGFGVGVGKHDGEVFVGEIEKNGVGDCEGKDQATDLGEIDECDRCETVSLFLLVKSRL